ncbi:hypothetical protein [Streptomyces sp. NPDC001652]|uniref:hypothetical protein n=1 Tax=Streptomyces sp. NPDC001652 TaxID=3154393 RepID=UPI003333E5C9
MLSHPRYNGRTTTLGAAIRHTVTDQRHARDADHPQLSRLAAQFGTPPPALA